MANPAITNGHFNIANELAEHFARVNIPGEEWRILWVLWRKTWGWKDGDRRKDWDWISVSQFERMTGMKRTNCHRALKSLLAKRLILQEENKLKFNQNYEQWVLAKRLQVLVNRLQSVSQKTNETVSQKTNYKRKKETIQKKGDLSLSFLEGRSDPYRQAWLAFIEMRKKKKDKPLTDYAIVRLLASLERLSQDEKVQISIIDKAIVSGWSGFFPLKEDNKPESQKPKYRVL
jgi:phage replication O-like protein O